VAESPALVFSRLEVLWVERSFRHAWLSGLVLQHLGQGERLVPVSSPKAVFVFEPLKALFASFA